MAFMWAFLGLVIPWCTKQRQPFNTYLSIDQRVMLSSSWVYFWHGVYSNQCSHICTKKSNNASVSQGWSPSFPSRCGYLSIILFLLWKVLWWLSSPRSRCDRSGGTQAKSSQRQYCLWRPSNPLGIYFSYPTSASVLNIGECSPKSLAQPRLAESSCIRFLTRPFQCGFSDKLTSGCAFYVLSGCFTVKSDPS